MKSEVLSIDLERDELNRNIGGGIPKDALILITGQDGSGKSIISQRMCYGLLQAGYTASYISSELDTVGFIEQMASLDYDCKYYLLDDDLMFVPMFPFYGKSRLQRGMLQRLMNSSRLYSKDVIILDTISFLIVQDDTTERELFQFIYFLKRLTSLGKTVIIDIDQDHIHPKLLTLVKNVSDVILELEISSFAGEIVRVMKVKRFKRSGSNVLSAIPYKVEAGKGLAIEIASFS